MTRTLAFIAALTSATVVCGSAHVGLIPVNRDVLIVSRNRNALSTSNALFILSGLKPGMEKGDLDRHMNSHGMTNRLSISLDRGKHYTSYYDFPGTDSTLVVETCSRRTGPDLFDWGHPVLEAGRIQRLGVDTFLITFTNGP